MGLGTRRCGGARRYRLQKGCLGKVTLPSLLCRAKPSVLSGLAEVLTLSPCPADPSPVSWA